MSTPAMCPGRMTMPFDVFVQSYRRSPWRGPLWRRVLDCLPGRRRAGYSAKRKPLRQWDVDWHRLGFELHFRVGDIAGYFGATKEDGVTPTGARWCWPWQWYRLYYQARFPGIPIR